MRRSTVTATLAALIAMPDAGAGSLADGKWAPANCGSRPALPVIASDSVDAYNRSLRAVRAWQQQAQAYNDCIVKEANADNDAIAQEANAEQERFRAAVDEVNAAVAAARAELDRQ